MMKQLKYGTACLLLLAAACGDDSDAFYTAVYPVVSGEAEITLPAPEPGSYTHLPVPTKRITVQTTGAAVVNTDAARQLSTSDMSTN